MILCDHWGLIGDSGQIVKIFCSRPDGLGTEGHVHSLFILLFSQSFSNCKIPFFSSWTLQKQSKDRMWSAGQFAVEFRSCFIKRPMKTESYLRILGGCASHILLDSVG